MSRTLTDPSGGNTINRVLPIYNGGSEEITAPDALLAFNGVPASEYNQPNGVASLNSQGKLPFNILPDSVSSSVSVTGPTLLYLGSKGQWAITNYDNRIQYTVTASAGFISRSDDIVYFTAPVTPQVVTINIGDKEFTVDVSERYIQKPEILSPLPEATNIGSGFIAQTDPFTIQGGLKEVILTASDSATGGVLGSSMAMTPDGSRIIIGYQSRTVSGFINCGQCYIYRQDGAGWVEEAIITASDKAANRYFGHSCAITSDGDRVIVGSTVANVGGSGNAECAYIFTRSGTTWAQEAKITEATGGTDDNFGSSVSIDSTGTRVAISAPYRDSGGTVNAGSVYIFTRSGTVWTKEGGITVADKVAGDFLGFFNVLLSSDGSRLAMSAHGRSSIGVEYIYVRSGTSWSLEVLLGSGEGVVGDLFSTDIAFDETASIAAITAYEKTADGITKAGKAYIFTRSGSTWARTDIIIASDKAANDRFGATVSLSADGSCMAIGTYNRDVAGFTDAGQVYIYVKSGSAWVEEAILSASDRAADDYFGSDIVMSADASKLAVIAGGRDSGGAVYIYDMSYHASTDWELSTDPAFTNIVQQSLADTVNHTSWSVSDLALDTDYYLRSRYIGTQYGTSEWSDTTHIHTRQSWLPINEMQILTASDKAASDNFGVIVALSSDGLRLAIGASLKDFSGMSNAGQVYIYIKSGASWELESTLTASDKATSDQFGSAIAFTDDASRIIIGAFGKTVNGFTLAGAAYIFSRSGSTWTQEAKLTAPTPAASDIFGTVTIDSTGTRVAVGAPWKATAVGGDAGVAYVFSRSGTTWSLEATITEPVNGNYVIFEFGGSVHLTADGSRLAVTSHGTQHSSLINAGSVFIYTRSGTVWTKEANLTPSDPAANMWFGDRVVITPDGSRVAISSLLNDPSGVTDAGAVYVFTRSGTTWAQEAKLTASDKATTDRFGFKVSINPDGSFITVGADQVDISGLTDRGAVYLFKRIGSTWTEEAKLSANDIASSKLFGQSLSFCNDNAVLAIGAPQSTINGVTACGAVYIFE